MLNPVTPTMEGQGEMRTDLRMQLEFKETKLWMNSLQKGPTIATVGCVYNGKFFSKTQRNHAYRGLNWIVTKGLGPIWKYFTGGIQKNLHIRKFHTKGHFGLRGQTRHNFITLLVIICF